MGSFLKTLSSNAIVINAKLLSLIDSSEEPVLYASIPMLKGTNVTLVENCSMPPNLSILNVKFAKPLLLSGTIIIFINFFLIHLKDKA